MKQQVGTLWLMSSTLNSLTQTGGDKHATRRKGRTHDTKRTQEGMEIKTKET